MIKLLRQGHYKLIETTRLHKILYLDDVAYIWIDSSKIGQFLEISYRNHEPATILSVGQYNLYDVEDEPYLFDLQHLELEICQNNWQGYLILTYLPNSIKRRSRIIPTQELIARNPRYRYLSHNEKEKEARHYRQVAHETAR